MATFTRHRFYDGWHRLDREPVGPISEDRARARHTAGEPYAVVIGEAERPSAFIEVLDGSYGVGFLDDQLREYMLYSFEEIGGRLFLAEVVHREFAEASGTVVRGTAYRFSPDGCVAIERSAMPFQRAAESEATADVSRNWQEKPPFGQYDQLIRRDR